ncbi:MAG: hypothetical protein ACLFWB_02925 [Armatimonadota bacterium]
MGAVEIVLSVAGVVILVALALQIDAYVRGRTIITARQLGMRIVCGVLLLLMIGLIYYGLRHTWDAPLTELLFWFIVTLFLPVMIVIVAFMDLRETTSRAKYHRAVLLSEAWKAGQEAQAQAREENGESE